MSRNATRILALALAGALAAVLLLATGCGGPGKPTLMSFTTPAGKSAQEFQPSLDKIKKELEGKVIFIDVDMSDPKNKATVEKYHVSMDPTYIILNAEGQVKRTFMGKPMEEMLANDIKGFLPSQPAGSATVPGTQVPSSIPTFPGLTQPEPLESSPGQ